MCELPALNLKNKEKHFTVFRFLTYTGSSTTTPCPDGIERIVVADACTTTQQFVDFVRSKNILSKDLADLGSRTISGYTGKMRT